MKVIFYYVFFAWLAANALVTHVSVGAPYPPKPGALGKYLPGIAPSPFFREAELAFSPYGEFYVHIRGLDRSVRVERPNPDGLIGDRAYDDSCNYEYTGRCFRLRRLQVYYREAAGTAPQLEVILSGENEAGVLDKFSAIFAWVEKLPNDGYPAYLFGAPKGDLLAYEESCERLANTAPNSLPEFFCPMIKVYEVQTSIEEVLSLVMDFSQGAPPQVRFAELEQTYFKSIEANIAKAMAAGRIKESEPFLAKTEELKAVMRVKEIKGAIFYHTGLSYVGDEFVVVNAKENTIYRLYMYHWVD